MSLKHYMTVKFIRAAKLAEEQADIQAQKEWHARCDIYKAHGIYDPYILDDDELEELDRRLGLD